jgi:hypothetical protein
MNITQPSAQNPFATLRQFVRPKAPGERCELCSAGLGPEHQHLIEPANRKLVCCCEACAVLFSGQQSARYRRVARRVQFLPDFHMNDAQWEELHIPINLAFFFRSSPAARIVAAYPSPAGATESLLTLEAWQDLEKENPVLRELEADVEGLLVNRVGPARDHYLAPIDECYKLVGLIRTNWKGLSGGPDVWREIAGFLTGLKEKSSPRRGTSDA